MSKENSTTYPNDTRITDSISEGARLFTLMPHNFYSDKNTQDTELILQSLWSDNLGRPHRTQHIGRIQTKFKKTKHTPRKYMCKTKHMGHSDVFSLKCLHVSEYNASCSEQNKHKKELFCGLSWGDNEWLKGTFCLGINQKKIWLSQGAGNLITYNLALHEMKYSLLYYVT